MYDLLENVSGFYSNIAQIFSLLYFILNLTVNLGPHPRVHGLIIFMQYSTPKELGTIGKMSVKKKSTISHYT